MDNTWFIYYLLLIAYNIVFSVEKTETDMQQKEL